MTEINLTDIPDLSAVDDVQETAPWVDGWYEGTILEKRQFTDKNGNDRVFESTDSPAASGESRNIRLQVQLKRQDGREMNVSTLVNYRPADLTQETVSQVLSHREKVKGGAEWGSLFRPFATLQRLGKLQKIAGVRQFSKNGNGGLDLHAIYGKKAYFRIQDDDRNPQYKAIADFRADAPKRQPVL